MQRMNIKATLTLAALLLTLIACEPLVPTPTPGSVVITATPLPATATSTPSPSPTVTVTPTLTLTPVPPTETPLPCTETEGMVLESSFYSAIQDAEVPYRMYFPPCYLQTQRRYPYVILLHGLESPGDTPYTGQQWIDLGIAEALDRGIALNHLRPMVLVMPDGGRVAATNVFDEARSYESVILSELMPAIESESSGYCLWAARQGRAIGGISRGGFWAFEIAFHHPEMFSAVAGHSPFFDSEVADAYDPIYMAGHEPVEYLSALRIAVDHGAGDYVQAEVRTFSNALSSRQVEHDYVVNPTGEHNDEYWSSHLTEYLAFYGQDWPQDPYELPSCLEPVE
jgi:enterochelin esterase-like enzyme